MTFSHTQPLVHARSDGAEIDPLYDAWSIVREARRVSLELGIEGWGREVSAMVTKVAGAIAVHTQYMESADSPLMQRLREPGISRIAQEQLLEHGPLAEAVEAIASALRKPGIDNGGVLAVAEQLIELEIRLARHLNRLHELIGRQAWQAAARS